MTLRPGARGVAVEELQRKLHRAGYEPGPADGVYGTRTQAAVLEFQRDHDDVADDGIAGPATLAKLDSVLRPAATHVPSGFGPPARAELWSAWERVVDTVTRNVRYGPGRGLYVGDRFELGYAPGRRSRDGDELAWPNVLGRRYPSLHCSSWTNMVLSWLTRRNEDFTHAGNAPALMELVAASSAPRTVRGVGTWRGFAGEVAPIAPDGSGAKRSGVARVLDARELYDRRGELPTFLVAAQSSSLGGGRWKWWHHTVVWCARDGRLYRIAADGWRSSRGYSATPMRWVEITAANVGTLAGAIYRVWGARSNPDGSYGDTTRPIAEVGIEA